MEYTFNKETRYITRGVNTEIPLEIQILILNCIDELVESNTKTDYLQVFKLKVENSELFSITHTQEQPEFKKVSNIKMKKEYSILNGKTVFVIDDKTHSTCLLSGEY